MKPNKPAI